MEYLGVLAFVIVLCYMSYPDKVKKLERKVKKLEKERCRESIMSKLIEELVGRDCKISSEKGINFVGYDLVEVMPYADPSQITAFLAGNIMFEFISLIALRKKERR